MMFMGDNLSCLGSGTSFDFSTVPPESPVSRMTITLKASIIMIKPLADRVLVQPKEAETKTASGIYIPDTAKEKPQQGKVIAVGPGKKDEPMEVKVGDEVIYGKYAGTEVTVENEKYLIVKQSDILAIL
jgi:chaperonin GroES